ncbi:MULTISPECIES: formate dehydrogenase accessory sulfurtransferase FdhD [Gulbenkiania]|uniref:Sulfur carrier protein FdhD n=1 Tax=Gulbenkiania indica TaxID=375574 RepID=A0A0K6H2L7_9NEIS|nr:MULTISPECIES: formate dehydrogenase accessory sulfurtransferase FdhD [Gulbenkiania]CUA85125.1 formate dehydrogenase family accessory protein FdhD [Gulbenkiania indica]
MIRLTPGGAESAEDRLAEEVPVALVYNDLAHAVMMATPADLEDFAYGFTLAEGIGRQSADLYDVDVRRGAQGIELRIELASACFAALKARRRQLAGRTGCGLCGVEQIDAVFRVVPPLPFSQTLPASLLDPMLLALGKHQALAQETGCTHAAAWFLPDGSFAQIREDVGRHVALDKLIGWRVRQPALPAGVAVISSRASYEMVHKAVSAGIEILVAVSAPTALAVREAEAAGLTLVGFARPGRANVYTHPDRIVY